MKGGSASSVQLNWQARSSGGQLGAAAPGLTLNSTTGQAVIGTAGSPLYQFGGGFWYGTGTACAISLPGDINASASISAADIIFLVNFVFRAGSAPQPCEAAGDVNCSGGISAADIIHLVNFIFKAGVSPCDVCTLIPGAWTCP